MSQNDFVSNNSEEKFIDRIKANLRTCTSFTFSVSFIKKAGLILIINDIKSALARGSCGKIVTSTYQNFTDIESLKTFHTLMSEFPYFDCHLDFDSFHDNGFRTIGFHTKGYLFEFDGNQTELVIGSSNITRYALLKNVEWNVTVKDYTNNKLFTDVKKEFDYLWTNTEQLNNDNIKKYSQKLDFAIERWDMDYDLETNKIKPNYMQRKALKEINRYRSMGLNKALIISSAGSGKTYLAAFDALNFDAQRLLYIVHEGSILKKSLETFQTVFSNSKTFGMYTGETKEMDANFIFSTNVTMSKSLEFFERNDFDYIVIDECHHSTASTYRKIMEYFQPEFILGITATPERMDNQDVFELFDENIPYELRLRDAIVNNLVVPFKYYGIRDMMVEYGLSKNEERRMISQLATEEHCEYIHRQIEQHRPPGKLKALAFCRNITHARMMADGLSEHYHTAYLTGGNTTGERIKAYNELQDDTKELEIIFTVDILNEGVDIPGVNTVLFLRPTESSTIFIQQLGRGLRKCEGKEYVNVLDFIGNNYKRSVQIAFALSSLSENMVLEKRLMKSLITDDFKALGLGEYGVEIHIDNLSKEELNKYLDSENFNKHAYLEQDYRNFKKYIHCETWPKHMDYLNNDCAPDLIRFMNVKYNGTKNRSYYNFLKSVEEDTIPTFNEFETRFIDYLSEMLPLVRPTEYLIFKQFLNEHRIGENTLFIIIVEQYHISFDEYQHAMKFIYENKYLKLNNGIVSLAVNMSDDLYQYLNDLITYGLNRFEIEFNDVDEFKLWSNYRLDQVQLKLLKNPGAIFKGTYIYGKNVYTFSSIKKDASIEEHLNYKDRFLDKNTFQWECESNLTMNEKQELIQSETCYLFIRKVREENGIVLPFTYVGKGKLTNPRETNNAGKTLLFDIHLEEPLPDYLQYDFGL